MGSRGGRLGTAAALALVALAGAVSTAQAKVLMTQEEALELAFPEGVDVQRHTAFLTEEQAREIQEASGRNLDSRVITFYVGRRDGKREDTAYFDTHVVRTLPETIMILVKKDATIGEIHILSFAEPMEYLPGARWKDQLRGHRLDEDLSLRGGIRPITGATLSARAIVSAARRTLALHHVLTRPGAEAEPGP